MPQELGAHWKFPTSALHCCCKKKNVALKFQFLSLLPENKDFKIKAFSCTMNKRNSG